MALAQAPGDDELEVVLLGRVQGDEEALLPGQVQGDEEAGLLVRVGLQVEAQRPVAVVAAAQDRSVVEAGVRSVGGVGKHSAFWVWMGKLALACRPEPRLGSWVRYTCGLTGLPVV